MSNKMNLRNQIIATAILCTASLNLGLTFSWPGANIMLFASENTTLSRPLTETEISLLGSLSSFGALLSSLIAGFLLDLLGRKKCSILSTVILILVWAVLSICNRVEVVLTCMFFSGMSGCLPIIASVYISEICHESIRGSMAACLAVCNNIGSLLVVGLGGSLSYDTVLYIGVIMTVSSTIAVLLMKDSPTHLLQNGKAKDAAKALAFYTCLKVHDKQVIEKLDALKRECSTVVSESNPEAQKLNTMEEPVEKLSVWQFMKKSESSRRALLVNSVLMIASNFQGLVVIQIYIQPLVADAVPTSSPVICSVVLAVIAVIAGAVGAYMTDVAGRRPLMIYGSIGSAICCLVIGTQMQFYWGPTWITLVFIYVFTVTITLGACTVPLVLLSELYLPEVEVSSESVVCHACWTAAWNQIRNPTSQDVPIIGHGHVCVSCGRSILRIREHSLQSESPHVNRIRDAVARQISPLEVRSILSMVVVELIWISKFIVLCIFSPTNIIFVGWGIVFYIFAVMCFLTSVFSFFYLPETMGLTVEEIQPLFLKREKRSSFRKKELL